MVSSVAELLEFCGETSRWPEASGTRAPEVVIKAAVAKVVQRATGSLLTTLFTTLWTLPLNLKQATDLLPPAHRLLAALDKLGAGLPELVAADNDLSSAAPKLVQVSRTVQAESSHPVPSGTTTVKVHVPGASMMTLVFDDKCFSHMNNGVTISMFGQANQQEPLGHASQMMQTVTVPTDTVYVARGVDVCWGYGPC